MWQILLANMVYGVVACLIIKLLFFLLPAKLAAWIMVITIGCLAWGYANRG